MKANQLATQLLKQAGRFDRLAKRVRERLDPDDVHDLCVLARRMRATAWLGRQVCRGAGPKDLHGLLGESRRGLGRLRALDVALADAAARRLPATASTSRSRGERRGSGRRSSSPPAASASSTR